MDRQTDGWLGDEVCGPLLPTFRFSPVARISAEKFARRAGGSLRVAVAVSIVVGVVRSRSRVRFTPLTFLAIDRKNRHRRLVCTIGTAARRIRTVRSLAHSLDREKGLCRDNPKRDGTTPGSCLFIVGYRRSMANELSPGEQRCARRTGNYLQ